MKNWPLATNNFGVLDRLKICGFFLNFKNRWTQDKYVKKFEKVAAKYVGAKYAICVSSGSAANDLIAEQTKDFLIQKAEWPKRNKVIINAVTWTSNISTWIRQGFEPVFIDVTLNDFCLNYDKLSEYLEKNHETVACVFPTSVLGYTPNINKLAKICQHFNVPLKLDNCENSEGSYRPIIGGITINSLENLCYKYTCSTSLFVAHQWSCGGELGLIFTNDKKEYEYFLLARAHGLRRNLIPYLTELEMSQGELNEKYTNRLVDPQFDFQTMSSNFRGTDIAAFMALLDSKKWKQRRKQRIELYRVFYDNLDKLRYYLPKPRADIQDVAFCLPIIAIGEGKEVRISLVKNLLDNLNIEKRSFISGNMLRQVPYQEYADYKNFEAAEHLNNFAVYIGLNISLKGKDIIELCEKLNKL